MTDVAMLDNTFKKLCPYDQLDLLAVVAGLQLVPQNSHHTLRLEAYAHTVASRRIHLSGHPITRPDLLAFLDDDGLDAGIHAQEDPCTNLFSECVLFKGGGYVVMPGIANSSTCILKNLAKALFLVPSPFPDSTFTDEAEHILGAALATSDIVAAKAGLTRWMATPERDGKVYVPDDDLLVKLKAAVTWPATALIQELRKRGLHAAGLQHIAAEASNLALDDWDLERPPLFRRPVLNIGNQYVVALPGALLSAAIKAVLDLAAERHVLDELAARYNAAVWDSTKQALAMFDLPRLTPVALPHAITCLRDGVVSIDTDKAMHVLVVTDPLDDYHPWKDSTPLDRLTRADAVAGRVREVELSLGAASGGKLNDIVHVVVLQGLSRDELFAVAREAEPDSKGLWLTLEDVDLKSLKESGNPLALWQFIRSREHARQSVEVTCFDVIDEYAFYLQHNHGYYLSDKRQPTVLHLQSGFSTPLRYEVMKKHDFHAVLSYDQQHAFEVVRLHGGDVPIYVPLKDIGKRAALLVEGMPVPVWVLGPSYESNDQEAQHSDYAQVTDAVAYWLWQFAPYINGALALLSRQFRHLRCLVTLPPKDQWEWRHERPQQGPVCIVTSDSNAGTLTVAFLPGLTAALMASDNHGERELVTAIFRGLRELLPSHHRGLLDEASLASALDRHAPLGLKKKFFSLDAAANPSLHPSPKLPPQRVIQEADQELILDAVGKAMLRKGWPLGPVATGDRDRFLRETVGCLFRLLEEAVARLSPAGLLDWLIAHHERLTREWAFLRLTLPTRIACFSNEKEVLDELQSNLPNDSHLRLSSRFVIEYVVARPPSGIRPISRNAYDELIALAAEIINFGALSDLCHFEIEDIAWSLLPSGRIGRKVERYHAVRQEYLGSHAVGQIHRAREGFGRHWVRHERQSSELQDRINAAMVAEVGLRFTDIMDVLGFAVNARLRDGDTVVCQRPETNFISEAAAGLKLPEDTIAKILRLLVLEPRSDYLDPTGYRLEDTYPWRLDRPISYVRRPFAVRIVDGQRNLLWGCRHVDEVTRYWCNAYSYGRIEARSPELKCLVSKLHNERGNDFNNAVADACEKLPDVIVRRKVKKIGKLKPPGDIDVLLAIPATRKLRLIECKDLEPARMPHEINAELLKTFKGRDGKLSAIEKHMRRLAWVQNHAEEVLKFLDCDDGHTWKAEALFVTDTELLTPFLRKSPVRFVPLAELYRVL